MAKARSGWLAIVAVAIAASTLTKLSDLDLFWHLASGRWIWEHRALPTGDPFSYASLPSWRPPEWLAQLYFHAGERAFGFAGVGLATAGLALALVLALVWLARESEGADGPGLPFALGLFGAAASFRLQPKPEQFSFVFFAVACALVARAERTSRARTLGWLVPLALVWGQLHRGATLALATLAVTAALWLVRPATRALGLRLAAILAACALVLTWNTSGTRYLFAGASVTSQAIYRQAIGEWASPGASFFVSANPFYGAWVALFAVAVAVRRRLDVETVVALVALALGLRALRFLPFGAIAMLPAVARLASAAVRAGVARLGGAVRPALVEALAVAAGLALVGARYVEHPTSQWGTGVLEWRVPVGAASFVAAHPPPGRMWNSFDFGGYLLYRLAPSQKVLIDGRNDQAYPPALFEEVVRATSDADVLRRSLDRFDAGFAVVQVPGLADHRYAWLQTSPDWQLVYLDDLAGVYVRRTEASRAYLDEHGYEVVRPVDALARAAAGPAAPFRPALERDAARMLAASPRSIRAHYLAATLARTAGAADVYARERAVTAELLDERGLAFALP